MEMRQWEKARACDDLDSRHIVIPDTNTTTPSVKKGLLKRGERRWEETFFSFLNFKQKKKITIDPVCLVLIRPNQLAPMFTWCAVHILFDVGIQWFCFNSFSGSRNAARRIKQPEIADLFNTTSREKVTEYIKKR